MGLLFFFFALLLPQSVSALTIQPSSFFYELSPGAEVSGIVTIQNEASEARTYHLVLQDVTSTDEEGTPEFFAEGVVTETSLASWLSFPSENMTLAAGETRDVLFTIHVPDGAESGGYYGALLFSSSQGEAESRLETRVGPLILVSVGAEEAQLELVDFSTERSWYGHLPATFTLHLRNDGVVPVQPTGTITISNMLGSTASVLALNEDGARVLPGVTRRLASSWQRQEVTADSAEVVKEWKNFGFGYYTAWLTVENGAGDVITGRTSFWVIPWQLLLGACLLIALVLFVCRRRVS